MISYSIEFYKPEFEELAQETNLRETIDQDCQFIVARNGSLAGIAGVNFKKNIDIPRFEHIIVSPRYQKTKLGGMLCFRAELWIKELGYHQYHAFILYGEELMRKYAVKFGFIEMIKKEKGSWFLKNI